MRALGVKHSQLYFLLHLSFIYGLKDPVAPVIPGYVNLPSHPPPGDVSERHVYESMATDIKSVTLSEDLPESLLIDTSTPTTKVASAEGIRPLETSDMGHKSSHISGTSSDKAINSRRAGISTPSYLQATPKFDPVFLTGPLPNVLIIDSSSPPASQLVHPRVLTSASLRLFHTSNHTTTSLPHRFGVISAAPRSSTFHKSSTRAIGTSNMIRTNATDTMIDSNGASACHGDFWLLILTFLL